MAAFRYESSQDPRLVATIGDLMLRGPQAQAAAAERIGQIQAQGAQQQAGAWSGAIQNIGQLIGNIPAQMQQQKRAALQDKLSTLQLNSATQSAQDDQRLRAAYQQSGGDPTQMRALLASSGGLTLQHDQALQQMEQQQAERHKAITSQIGLSLHDQLRPDDPTGNLAAMQDALNAAEQHQLITSEQAQQFGAMASADPSKIPDVAKKWAGMTAAGRAEIEKTITNKPGEVTTSRWDNTPVGTSQPEKKPDYTINGVRFDGQTNQPFGPAVPKQTEPAKLGSPEDFVSTYAKEKFGVAPEKMTVAQKSEALGAFKEANADQELRASALAQKNIALALAQLQFNQAPTKEQAASVADDLVHHRVSPEQLASLFSTRGKEGLSFKLNVATEAKKLDPSFNFEEASAEYMLAKSTGFQNTVRYMDSALESIPRLLQNSQNLGNGNFRTLNQLANAAKGQFNSTDLKRFKTDALLVGDEIAKILSGGGSGSATSDAKLKQATDIIGSSDSVPAIAAAMEEVQSLMGNRRRALTRGTYMEKLGGDTPNATTTPTDGQTRTVGSDTVTWKTVNGKTGWYK